MSGFLRAAVESILDAWPAERPLRIVEIGGNVPSVAAQILPALPRDRCFLVYLSLPR